MVAKSKPAPVPARPIACYLRVSSRSQTHDSQREVLGQWLAAHGIDLDRVQWYVDTESGRKMSRPAFDQLRADIFSGVVKTVIVYKLDRLARRLREGLDLLCDWSDAGVRVVSVTQSLDLSGTVGKMVAAVLLALAQIEAEYREERQRAGIAVAKRKGVYKGRRPGTSKADADRAKKLKAKGLTVAEVATALGISGRTAARYLAS